MRERLRCTNQVCIIHPLVMYFFATRSILVPGPTTIFVFVILDICGCVLLGVEEEASWLSNHSRQADHHNSGSCCSVGHKTAVLCDVKMCCCCCRRTKNYKFNLLPPSDGGYHTHCCCTVNKDGKNEATLDRVSFAVVHLDSHSRADGGRGRHERTPWNCSNTVNRLTHGHMTESLLQQ